VSSFSAKENGTKKKETFKMERESLRRIKSRSNRQLYPIESWTIVKTFFPKGIKVQLQHPTPWHKDITN